MMQASSVALLGLMLGTALGLPAGVLNDDLSNLSLDIADLERDGDESSPAAKQSKASAAKAAKAQDTSEQDPCEMVKKGQKRGKDACPDFSPDDGTKCHWVKENPDGSDRRDGGICAKRVPNGETDVDAGSYPRELASIEHTTVDVFFNYMDEESFTLVKNLLRNHKRSKVKPAEGYDKVANYDAVFVVERGLSESLKDGMFERPWGAYRNTLQPSAWPDTTPKALSATQACPVSERTGWDWSDKYMCAITNALNKAICRNLEAVNQLVTSFQTKPKEFKNWVAVDQATQDRVIQLSVVKMGLPAPLDPKAPKHIALNVRLPDFGKQANVAFMYIKGVLRALKLAGITHVNAFGVGAGGAADRDVLPGFTQAVDASLFVGALTEPGMLVDAVEDSDTPNSVINARAVEYVAFVGVTPDKKSTLAPQGGDRFHSIDHMVTNDVKTTNSFDTGMMYEINVDGGGLVLRDQDGEITEDTKTGSSQQHKIVQVGDMPQDKQTGRDDDFDLLKSMEDISRKRFALFGAKTSDFQVQTGPLKGEKLSELLKRFQCNDVKDRQKDPLPEDFTCTVDLTVCPSLGAAREKEAALQFGLADANQEDYWLLKAFVTADQDVTGEYPVMLHKGGFRVHTDPFDIKAEEVVHFKGYLRELDTMIKPREQVMEGIRFRFLGWPFEDCASKDVPLTQEQKDAMWKMVKWDFPAYLKKVEYMQNIDAVKKRFIGFVDKDKQNSIEDYWSLDPYVAEVAADMLGEFHIAWKWTEFPMPKDDAELWGKWAKRKQEKPVKEWLKEQEGLWTSAQELVCLRQDSTAKGQCVEGPLKDQEMKEKSETVVTDCSTDAAGEKCTCALRAYVDSAATIMWMLYDSVAAYCKKIPPNVKHTSSGVKDEDVYGCNGWTAFPEEKFTEEFRESSMPLWSRGKTGQQSHGMLGWDVPIDETLAAASSETGQAQFKAMHDEYGKFVDRGFYKANNQLGLVKMNDAMWRPRKTNGCNQKKCTLMDNMQYMRKHNNCAWKSVAFGDQCYESDGQAREDIWQQAPE